MRRLSSWLQLHAATLRSAIASRLTFLLARCSGQGLVEYGLILVLIMIVCVSILTIIGITVSGVWYGKVIETFPH